MNWSTLLPVVYLRMACSNRQRQERSSYFDKVTFWHPLILNKTTHILELSMFKYVTGLIIPEVSLSSFGIHNHHCISLHLLHIIVCLSYAIVVLLCFLMHIAYSNREPFYSFSRNSSVFPNPVL